MKAFLALVLGLVALPLTAQAPPSADAAAKVPGILSSAAVQQLMPPSVFFSGQSATVQVRNSGGIRFADGKLALAGLVDTGGYSTSVREKYQFYLITEVPLEVDGHHIAPGAYGCGFVGGKFLVMDIGGGDMFQSATKQDASLKRPRPLQVIAGGSDGELKIYIGREMVSLKRAR